MIERSRSDPDTFGVIFDRHFDAIHAYLAKRIGGGRADDLAASTFAVAFERRHRFRRESSTARPWLFGIASNLLRNEWRAERRASQAIGHVDVREEVSREEVDFSPRLEEMLAGLASDQREALLLYAWEELSYEEIAVALGIPVGTVRSRLARAREHLRRSLSDAEQRESRAHEANG